ncbi:ribonuclease H-like domain-containing protein [Tuber indicum]|nr:ribonuclease H-like domain-containing protein [Tuber indicum]
MSDSLAAQEAGEPLGFSEMQDRLLAAVVATVKTSSGLAAEDVDFHRASNSEFGPSLDDCNERILAITNRLLASATCGSNISAPKLKEADDVENHWTKIVEVIDDLLEKADTCLDEYTGAIKERNPVPFPGARAAGMVHKPSRPSRKSIQRSADIPKPQLLFKERIDNFDSAPWKPRLTSKPHAVTPLGESIYLFKNELGINEYAHPYQAEIESMEYPKEVYSWMEPIPSRDWDEIPPTWVDTPRALQEMIKDMRRCTEIAVDLEHHDTRTYIGLTCLMQLSTRDDDYIVDTLKLRGQLEPLNEIFTNPRVIKVLHGAFMDIIWLQRDLGLYIVGLFDTFYAAQALEFARFGLAHILKKYVNFDADKQYQMADWRLRPLPKEMLDYARSDTHYLLYCFDCMRNSLVEKSRGDVEHVLQKSKETALRRYIRDTYDAATGEGTFGWASQIIKFKFNRTQEFVFKAVHAWRDQAAREEDESPTFVCSRSTLGALSTAMPTDSDGVAKCIHHTNHLAKRRIGEIVEAIKGALEQAGQADEAATEAVAATATATPGASKTTVNIFGDTVVAEARSATSSMFWGNVCGSSKWDEAATLKSALGEEIRLAIPLPELTAAVFVSETPFASSAGAREVPIDPGARAEHQYVKGRGGTKRENEIIVVKSLGGGASGRKRKASEVEQYDDNNDAISDDHSTHSPDYSSHGGSSQEGSEGEEEGDEREGPLGVNAPTLLDGPMGANNVVGERKSRKQSKNSPGQGQQEANASARGTSLVDVRESSFEPLDYSKAPSVLHGEKRSQGKAGADGSKTLSGTKRFDPYSKFGEGPKGVRRSQQEKAGKSLTFKS